MQQADNQPSLLFILRTVPVQAMLRSEILCCFSHPKITLQGLGSLAQDISIVHMFSCYGNKKAYATVGSAALTTALLASFCQALSFVCLCECLYFYSQDIPPQKSKGHYRTDTPNFLCCKTLLQVLCASEIPRIFMVLSLSLLTVLQSEVYKTLDFWIVCSPECSGYLSSRPLL